MIGNDLIFIKALLKYDKLRLKKFAGKVLDVKETECFKNHAAPFLYLWSAWAAKESAYKAAYKEEPIPPFRPKEFSVTFADALDSKAHQSFQVIHGDQILFGRLLIDNRYIYAFVSVDPALLSKMQHSFLKFPNDQPQQQSRLCYQTLANRLHKNSTCKTNSIRILKKNGVPVAYYKEQKLPFHLSITHHGRQGAVCWCAI